jgi:hypothetical protein
VAIRTLQVLGRGANGASSIGVSLDKSELRQDGLVDDEDEPADVPVAISRDGPGRYVVEALELPPGAIDDE